jgi:hypothetical protein
MKKLIKLHEKNYISTASEGEVHALVELRAPVILLTPHKSRCTGLDDLTRRELKATPTQLLRNIDKISLSHVLVEDSDMMGAYGYTDDLAELQKRVFFIVLKCKEPPCFVRDARVLNTRRCFIRLSKDDRYIAVFVLCRIYSGALVVCSNPRKARLFADILKLDCQVQSHGESVSTRICILLDKLVEVECEQLFYIGERCDEMEETYFDMGRAGKYIYRVRCVCEALTPAVVSGRAELGKNRFININRG